MWWLRVIALNGVAGVIELLYAVEGAYFVPAIYDQGLSPIYGSMLLLLSPILGIVFQSYLGSASDQCKCRWGKRRPFILALGIIGICGLSLFPFTENIANLLSQEKSRFVVLLVLITLATTLTDFSVGALQSPSRAYLLDVLPVERTKFGNIICSIWIPVGGTVGFGLGAINWSSDFNVQIKIVCGISVILTVICVAMTLFSVNEQNPQLSKVINSDQILSATNVLKDDLADHVHTDKDEVPDNKPVTVNGNLDSQTQCNNASINDLNVELMQVTQEESSSTSNNIHHKTPREIEIQEQCALRMKYLSIEDLTIIPYEGCTTGGAINHQADCGCRCGSDFVNSIIGNIRFTRYMSLSMIILFFAQFFAFLAIYTQAFFFTDFVGEVIYNGDVTAPENSTAYRKYTEGVRIGSLVFGVSAFSSLATALLLGPAMKLFGVRLVYVSSYVFSMLQSGVMIFNRNVVVLFVLSPALFSIAVVLLTIPYILVSEYDKRSILLRKPWPYADKNLIGRACSILIIALLSSQVVSLLINGPLKDLFGSAVSVMIVCCASFFVGAVIACFVTIPHKENKRKDNCKKKNFTKITHRQTPVADPKAITESSCL